MKNTSQLLAIALVAATFTAFSCETRAGLTFELGTNLQPDNPDPDGPTPWLVAVFEEVAASNDILLTITNNLTHDQFVSDFAFNILIPTDKFGSLSVTQVGPTGPTSPAFLAAYVDEDGEKITSFKGFDVRLEFETTGNDGGIYRFGSGDVVKFKISLSGTNLTEPYFDGKNQPTEVAHVAAHVQAIYPSGKSTTIGDPAPPIEAPPVVPEPSSIVLLGLGGIGMGISAWRRRRLAVA
jgi:hypothetical protein